LLPISSMRAGNFFFLISQIKQHLAIVCLVNMDCSRAF
jgi:hypothetical protein